MRAKRTFLLFGVIGVWIIISYYILINQSSAVNDHRDLLNEKLEYLENSIRDQALEDERTVRKIVNLIKLKNTLIENVVNEINSNQNNIAGSESAIKEIPLEGSIDVAKDRSSDPKYWTNFTGPIIPVLVFACDRISVSQCLDNLIEHRPNVYQFPIIVSQDCNHDKTREVILSYKDEVSLIIQPDQSDIYVPPKEKKFKGYYKIARHYGWAINTTFQKGYDFLIIVEDDLNVAPDFFDYFLGTHQLLKLDPTLWCISAWNDNGKENLIDSLRSDLLYRSDFFPGLGWMMTKELWDELSVKWPKSFWDDWIRDPQQRKDRVCIRPEIPRTRTFGKVGVSNGLFFEKHLKYIKLSTTFYGFSKANVSYLLKDNYDSQFIPYVYSRPVVTFEELRQLQTTDPVRIQYNTKDQFKRTAKMLGLMDDFKSGVPRTGYHGIISFMYNNKRVYLAPNTNWKGYNLSWS